jgi:hypothetical protein
VSPVSSARVVLSRRGWCPATSVVGLAGLARLVVLVGFVVLVVLAGACDRRRADDGAGRAGTASSAAPLPADAALEPAVDAAIDPAVDAAIDAPPGAELVVIASTPRPGASSIIVYEATLDLDLNFGGIQTITSSKQSKRKKVEFVAADPDGTVHKRITYLKLDTRMIIDGEPRKDVTPIRGKTYAVTWKDTVIAVRRPGGAPVTPEEDAAVRREETQLQVPELLGKALGGLALVEGVPFEVPIAAVEKVFTGEYRPRRMVLTYRGKTPDGARVDVEAALASRGEGTRFYLDLEAALVVDPTGWCRHAQVAAQIRAELGGAVVGSGAGSGTVTATPLK